MIRRVCAIGAVGAVALAACADEDPTGLGTGLVPGGEVHTFELVLDGSRVFESGAAFRGYDLPSESGRVVVAEDAGGRRDAHTLARFGGLPQSVEYEDSAGDTQVDSDPTFVGAELIVSIDSIAMAGAGPMTLRLLRLTEAWDAQSANWTMRVDTGGVQLPWNEPGGTAGEFVDTATWMPDDDSLIFAVDSSTVAAWTDTDDDARGALIAAETPGARLFGTGVSLRLKARPSQDPDTLVDATTAVVGRTFISDPVPETASALWVGGLPSWRAFLRFRERLDTVTVPAPDGSGSYRLGDLTVNTAMVSLVPTDPPAGLAPEDTISFVGRIAHEDDDVPLARSPIGGTLVVSPNFGPIDVPRDAFGAGSDERYEVPATRFIGNLLESADGSSVQRTIAFSPTRYSFGIGAFAPPGAADDVAPRLHLVVTVADEVEIR